MLSTNFLPTVLVTFKLLLNMLKTVFMTFFLQIIFFSQLNHLKAIGTKYSNKNSEIIS